MVWWRRERKERPRFSTPPPPHGASSGAAKPEVRTMTQGVTFRASGLGFDETAGLAGAAGILEAAAAGAVGDRSLRAAGERCAHCGRECTADMPVRRTVAGTWVHDVCPE